MMKRTPKLSPAAGEILGALTEFRDELRGKEPIEHPGMTPTDPDAAASVLVPTVGPSYAETPRFYFAVGGVVVEAEVHGGVTIASTVDMPIVGPDPEPEEAETWRDRPPML
jgi:hypothetical protein